MNEWALKEIVDGFTLSFFAVFAFIAIIVIPLYIFGPQYETKFWPVVTEYRIKPIEGPDKNYVWYEVEFNKVRQCTPIAPFQWYLVDQNGIQTRVDMSTTDAPIDRPVGTNRIRFYRVDSLREGEFVSQRLVLTHHCHFLWTTQTIINIPIGSESITTSK